MLEQNKNYKMVFQGFSRLCRQHQLHEWKIIEKQRSEERRQRQSGEKKRIKTIFDVVFFLSLVPLKLVFMFVDCNRSPLNAMWSVCVNTAHCMSYGLTIKTYWPDLSSLLWSNECVYRRASFLVFLTNLSSQCLFFCFIFRFKYVWAHMRPMCVDMKSSNFC